MSLIPNEEAAPAVEETPAAEEQPGMIESSDDAPAYLYADGIAGEGEKPEWFKDTKYKTIGDQAKAYTELESKFGAFTGAPKDGVYEVEGIDFAENPLMDTVAKWGAEKGLSNEGLTELVSQVGELANKQLEEDKAAAMEALGENGQARINDIAEWGKNNLAPEDFAQFQGLVQTAGHVEVVEKLIGMTKNSKLVKKEAIEDVSAIESKKAELQKMQFEKDENGRRLMEVDPAHRAKVLKLMGEIEGK